MNLVALLKEVKNKGITLYLNDGKLAFKAPAGAMDKALKSQIVALKVELVELLEKRENAETTQIEPIDRQPGDVLVTSFAQQRLWLLDKIDGGSTHYNIPEALKITGALKLDVVAKAFSSLVSRHESLRTYFVEDDDGQPVQKIQDPGMFDVVVIDFSSMSDEEQQAKVMKCVELDAAKPFDLSCDFMLRVQILKLSDVEHILLVTMHHIASDGWSRGILINEFIALYTAYSQGKENPLEPLPIQYADYAYWQHNWLQGEVLDKQLVYWEEQLVDLPIVHGLPLKSKRPLVQSFTGETYDLIINKQTNKNLNQFCQDNGATLFMGLHAVFSVLLARYSNEIDIVMGSPSANREQPEVASLIGFFMNNLVLRCDLSNNPSFIELIARSKRMLLDAYAHQQVPFEQIVEKLQPERSLSHSPLFQIMLVLQNNDEGTLEIPDIKLSQVQKSDIIAKYDVILNISEKEEGLLLSWEYNTDLFTTDTITGMGRHFEQLLEALLCTPEQDVFKAKMLGEAEYHQQLVTWNNTALSYPKDKCIHELFEAQVEKTPNAIAVVIEDKQLSYRELNQLSNQWAHYLIEQGVNNETLVGICIERSLELMVSVLAILKAGGAYVPLDPAYPKVRLDYMLQDTGLKHLLSRLDLITGLDVSDNVNVIEINPQMYQKKTQDYPATNLKQSDTKKTSDLAYVTYTSGPTGQAKGVMIEHKSLVNNLLSQVDYYSYEENASFIFYSSYCVDGALEEYLLPLIFGGKTVVFSQNKIFDLELFINTLVTQEITKANITPALLLAMKDQLCNIYHRSLLKTLVVGGEKLPTSLAKKLVDTGYEVVNSYGPTECTIDAVRYRYSETIKANTSIIGKAVVNHQLYIMDNNMGLIPIGSYGELYIGGDGLARGYLNNPELTQDRFVNNPYYEADSVNNSKYLYKTGDLVRYLADGNLEYVGRTDEQVKLRGFRIELGEIEHQLSEHEGVDSALVLTIENDIGNKQLIAYLKPELGHETDIDDVGLVPNIQQSLKQVIPDYMIPERFILMHEWPLTHDGKIDRSSLPKPDMSSHKAHYIEPSTATERALIEIWQQILKIETIGINDNFFDVGGNSIRAIKLMTKIDERYELRLPIRTLFELQTVTELAVHIDFLISQQKINIPDVDISADIQQEEVIW
ncbi:non-ribosomal peptide synthetase [Colwellia psychrerythraea]|uniref:Amino acid adenylation domain protein n=1 Tax=Colwellia psychrerythraea TaxID=28229 RepID=A0A099K916_COLPS|nr:non-ribosomal peptide synthetase [Colwellia psychrerythraea]KGJ86780.1 amino acid adenylation domain protein [Colwellia psychrerythraea]